MKIAAITDDGLKLSRHFGRAPYFMVLTVEDGEVVNREQRDKYGHGQIQLEGEHHSDTQDHQEGGHHGNAQGRHGYGTKAKTRHEQMAASITDCQVLLCGGMGWGAYETMKEKGITPILTDIEDIDEAVARLPRRNHRRPQRDAALDHYSSSAQRRGTQFLTIQTW